MLISSFEKEKSLDLLFEFKEFEKKNRELARHLAPLTCLPSFLLIPVEGIPNAQKIEMLGNCTNSAIA